MPIARLTGRAAIDISGAEADTFLQNLITTDVAEIPPGMALPGALLTPQGKILFDFLVSRLGDGYRLEFRAELAPDLLRRLTLYRLRAKVDFSLQEQDVALVGWEIDSPGEGWLRDARFRDVAVWRCHADAAGDTGEAQWHDLRIRHGIGESGTDYELGEAFPHDVLLDQTGGVSFRKGCFVGQEVVSRMQHRGTARRRLILAEGSADLPAPGTELKAAERPVGVLGSVTGRYGLAMVRLDRVARAVTEGMPILAGGVEVTLSIPGWANFDFPQEGGTEA